MTPSDEPLESRDFEDALPLPPELRERLAGYDIDAASSGESAAIVFKLSKTGCPDLYLKHGRSDVRDDILEEAARLRWMRPRLPVPDIVCLTVNDDAAWLVTQALEGQAAFQVLEEGACRAEDVVDALARFLRQVHATPTQSCPFDSRHPLRLSQARRNIDAGLVDTDDFDAARQGWSAEQVWEALQICPLPNAAPVVTHGDFSLDNVLLRNGVVVGCIDVGKAGLADPYQDIAIMWNNLGEFGTPLQDRFLKAYGITELDRDRLNFHLLLDELF